MRETHTTQALATAARLAAQEAAARLTDFVADQGADAADHLPALFHLASACIAAVAPYDMTPADELLASACDDAIAWHDEATQALWWECLEAF